MTEFNNFGARQHGAHRRPSPRLGRHVGRVGALAFALGVGISITANPPVAWADTSSNSTSSSTSRSNSDDNARNTTRDATEAGTDGDSTDADADDTDSDEL